MYLYLVENPRKNESVNSELARGYVSKFYWLDSNKKLSVGACKSYCMNFNSFKIVDSSLP